MVRYLSAQKAEIDIHEMTADQAKRYIENFLRRVNPAVKEVTIIHGYSSGTILLNMVRKQLKHPKIKSKVLSFVNPGITILYLN